MVLLMQGWTALHCTAVNNHSSIARAILSRGATVHETDDQVSRESQGQQLHKWLSNQMFANDKVANSKINLTHTGHRDVHSVKVPCQMSVQGQTPLHHAVINDCHDVAEVLLAHSHGSEAFFEDHKVCMGCAHSISFWLLCVSTSSSFADVTVLQGYTCVACCIMNDNLDMLKLLLSSRLNRNTMESNSQMSSNCPC